MKINFDETGFGKLILDADTEAEEKLLKRWYKQIIQQLEKCNFEEVLHQKWRCRVNDS